MLKINKKTVLYLTPTFYPVMGGSESFADSLISLAVERDYNFIVISCVYPSYKVKIREIKNGIIIYRLPILYKKCLNNPILYLINIFPVYFIFSFLYCLLKFKTLNIVHSNSSLTGLTGLIIGKVFKIKTIGTTHGLNFNSADNIKKFGVYQKFISYIFKNHDLMLANGDKSVEELKMLGVSPKKIIKYTHWVDFEKFKPFDGVKIRKKYKLDKNDFLCLFIGRFVEEKGINFLINIINKYSIHDKCYKFIFLGDGILRDELLELKAKNNQVLDVKKVDREALPLYYSAADVCLIPSIGQGESYNMVAIEAISCESVVMASRAGGMFETLHMDGSEQSLVGVSLEKVESFSWYSEIDKLRNDLNLIRKYKNNCRFYAKKYFSKNNIDAILNSYK